METGRRLEKESVRRVHRKVYHVCMEDAERLRERYVPDTMGSFVALTFSISPSSGKQTGSSLFIQTTAVVRVALLQFYCSSCAVKHCGE